MASIGSLTSSTSTSIRGYGGLASGLDRDELIKSMTLGTTSKLNQQEQKKQKIEWMQEAVRTISDKMISFHGKYTETLTSPTNLFSSMLWGRNKITTSGDNSKYVSVTGTASGADAITIMGIKQKAQNASLSSTGMASDSILKSEAINVDQEYLDLRGKTLDFTYGDTNDISHYSIIVDKVFKSNEEAANYIQERLNAQKIDENTKLGDLVKITGDEKGFTIKKADGASLAVNQLKLSGGTALGTMGIILSDSVDFKTQDSVSTDGTLNTKTFSDMVKGQSLTFSYNGTEAKIEIGNDVNNLEDVKASIQKSLDAKFGEGRVSVQIKEETDPNDSTKKINKLTFETTVPGENGKKDTSSTLKITGGSDDALMALGLSRGLTNRTNLDAKISTAGFQDFKKNVTTKDEKGNETTSEEQWYRFKLNGADVEVKEGATVRDLMNAINKSGANVTVSYQEAADKFTFTSKVNGASGVIDFTGNKGTGANSTLSDIFGLRGAGITQNVVRGQDAIVAVKYAGSDEEVELRRDSNTFTVDGLTIALKGEFGYKDKIGEDGKVVKDDKGNTVKERDHSVDAVEVNASVDVDKLMDTIKSFVADYNAIVDMVNGELTTKHDRDYDPLTSDQKSELSETEISKWETKAKEGLLYGDSDLRSLSMDLRVVVSGGILTKLADVGINLSSSYSDNGKLSIDETKLRAALETDPESVEKLFTSKAGTDADGNETFNGLATNLKTVMDKYVKTTGPMEEKGILIRKAGSKSAAQSLTQNTYYNQLTALDKLINQLKDRLKTEQDRYISQFTSLETAIANMNSQSSYLSSMGGF